MLQLLLLRHAKSSWTDPGLDDLDRPLSKRGKEAALAMSREMRALGLAPDLVLCSPAKRARDTWKIAAGQLQSAPRVVFDEQIYDFGNGGRVLAAIRAQGVAAPTLLVVGHNPSLERLCQRLATSGERKLRARLEQKYPTAALAQIQFDAVSWPEMADGGELLRFIRPKDILPKG